MKLLTIISLLLTLNYLHLCAQNCESPNDYLRKMAQADSCIQAGDYEMAQNHYNSAKIYCTDKGAEVDNAQNKLFDTIDSLRQEAQKAQDQADSTAEAAKRINKNLKDNIAQVVLLQLKQADQAILNLAYDAALAQTNRIADLGELPDSTLKRYQEIAYWYAETEQSNQAIAALDSAARHLRQPDYTCPNPTRLSKHIAQLNPQHHLALQKRYYPEMIEIKGGTYTMGSPPNEINRQNDEQQHPATISNFKIARTETTVFQFALYCRATYANDTGIQVFLRNATEKNDARHPVVTVNWYDAVQYLNWLSQRQQYNQVYSIDKQNKDPNNHNEYDDMKWTVKLDSTAQGYRLPTEAEWEYACRASTGTPFNTGTNLNTAQANYDGDSPYANYPKGINRQKTTPAGSFAPNAWGLYDMHGNVWEWCHDWYKAYLALPPSNYLGATSGSYRVLRGGAWYHDAQYCRSAYRRNYDPSSRINFIGFRSAWFAPR